MGTAQVPARPGAYPGEELRLRLRVEGGGTFSATAQVIEVHDQDDPPTLRVLIRAEPDLRALVDQYARKRREGRLSALPEGRRKHARYYTHLSVRFASYSRLGDAYATNIGQGGLFVRTREPPPVGSQVNLTLTLPNGEASELEGQVVRVVTLEMAAAGGQEPGVGLVFTGGGPGCIDRIEQLLTSYRQRPFHVLLVDDDRYSLGVLGDLMRESGFRVELAESSADAVLLLVECLFDLDALVFEPLMPQLDGMGLVERLRRLGTSLDLRLVALSASDEASLSRMRQSGGLDDALNKGLPPKRVIERIRSIIGRRRALPDAGLAR